MQVPAPIEYERATSVEHAIGLLARLGEEARLIAGGHSLLPMMKLRLANPEYLVDINDLHDELGYIEIEPTEVRIGAMTRHRELLESDALAAAVPDLPRRRAGDRRPAGAQPRHPRRRALPGRPVRGPLLGVHDARRDLRDPRPGGAAAGVDGRLPRGPYETAVGHAEMLIEVRIPVRPAGQQRLRQGRPAGRRLGGRRRRRRGLAGRRRHHHRRPGRPRRGRPEHDRHPGGLRGAARPGAVARRRSPRPAAIAAASCRPVTDQRGQRRLQAAPGRRADPAHPAHARGPRRSAGDG